MSSPSVSSCDPIGGAISSILAVLEGLSGRDRLRALRACAGAHGHRVLPGNGTFGPTPARGVPAVGSRPMAPAQPRSSKSAEQKKIDAEIRELNSRIKAKSAACGERLSETDPLIERRQWLFRVKHERATPAFPPHSGADGPDS